MAAATDASLTLPRPVRALAERRAAPTRLYGIGTALPAHAAPRERGLAFMRRVLAASHPARDAARAGAFLERLVAGAGIERRHSVLADYLADDPAAFTFFPPDWSLEPFPTTAARMRAFEQHGVPLAEAAARRALAAAGAAPAEVTDIILTTCTGFFAPGPELALVERLGLPAGVRRAVLGFMGCHAGFAGLRLADDIVRARPGAVVLEVCLELCSLHYQKRLEPDFLVGGALFADGASAAVYAAAGARDGGLADVAAAACRLAPSTAGQMSWRIGDHGFEMHLDRAIPETLGTQAPDFTRELLGRAGLTRGEAAGWAVHPGGRRIVEAVAESLALSADEAADSFAVLRDCGNMSSATILFVLERVLARRRGPVVALGFGPGLTMEGAVLLWP